MSDSGRRIYLDVNATVFATVSEEDYAWAIQWKWQITWDRHKRKMYATRTTRTKESGGRRFKLYLHKEILKRSGKVQPSEKHHMGDHGDGDSLNCQRWNVNWATPSQNRRTARPPARPTKEPQQEIPF
jgi:hypothetical protein